MKKLLLGSLATAALVALAACSGGGGGSSTPSTSNPNTGGATPQSGNLQLQVYVAKANSNAASFAATIDGNNATKQSFQLSGATCSSDSAGDRTCNYAMTLSAGTHSVFSQLFDGSGALLFSNLYQGVICTATSCNTLNTDPAGQTRLLLSTSNQVASISFQFANPQPDSHFPSNTASSGPSSVLVEGYSSNFGLQVVPRDSNGNIIMTPATSGQLQPTIYLTIVDNGVNLGDPTTPDVTTNNSSSSPITFSPGSFTNVDTQYTTTVLYNGTFGSATAGTGIVNATMIATAAGVSARFNFMSTPPLPQSASDLVPYISYPCVAAASPHAFVAIWGYNDATTHRILFPAPSGFTQLAPNGNGSNGLSPNNANGLSDNYFSFANDIAQALPTSGALPTLAHPGPHPGQVVVGFVSFANAGDDYSNIYWQLAGHAIGPASINVGGLGNGGGLGSPPPICGASGTVNPS